MSSSDNSEAMTNITELTGLNWTMDDSMVENDSSPIDSLMFKAIFIPLYSVVFCLCFAGQLLVYSTTLLHCNTSNSCRFNNRKQRCANLFVRPPDIVVGGLMFYHGFFLSSFFLSPFFAV